VSRLGWRHPAFAPVTAAVAALVLYIAGLIGALLESVGATTVPPAAELVVTLVVAVFLTTVLRIARTVPDLRREAEATARAARDVQAVDPAGDTLVAHRLRLFKEAARAGGDAEAVLSARSALDEAEVSNKHHLDHALIWALPVFGFIGTALTMATMVTAFGGALDSRGDAGALITALKRHVLPELASAFGVTLIALFLSVLAFGAMALVERAERERVAAADEVFLNLLARLPVKQAAPAMHGLSEELSRSRGATEELVKGLDALRTAVDALAETGSRPQRYTLVREK
jgi:hypothetical protein